MSDRLRLVLGVLLPVPRGRPMAASLSSDKGWALVACCSAAATQGRGARRAQGEDGMPGRVDRQGGRGWAKGKCSLKCIKWG